MAKIPKLPESINPLARRYALAYLRYAAGQRETPPTPSYYALKPEQAVMIRERMNLLVLNAATRLRDPDSPPYHGEDEATPGA